MTATAATGLDWMQPPSISEIGEAADRLRGILVETPLLESERLNERLGGRVLVKAEGLQHTGSFKVRGAWNRLSLRAPEEGKAGLVALSSGNHGQAVAWVARRLGIGPVTILVPDGTPSTKVERMRGWGAQIVPFDPASADRPSLIPQWTEAEGRTYIPAYDDRRIIAGAGTVGLEVLAQARAVGAWPDLVVVSCSGGGLSAGCAIAVSQQNPSIAVLAVEPEGYDDTARSLAAGTRQTIVSRPPTICDALLAPTPGELTFTVNASYGTKATSVDDRHTEAAMAVLFQEFRLVVEPGGAIALAALLADRSLIRQRTAVVVASGANVDEHLFGRVINSGYVVQ